MRDYWKRRLCWARGGNAKAFPELREHLSKLRRDAVEQGLDIGLIDGIGWLPRDVSKKVGMRLTEEQRTARLLAGMGDDSAEDAINKGLDNVFDVTSEGRRAILAGLPAHQFERMLNQASDLMDLSKPNDINKNVIKDMLRKSTSQGETGFQEVLDRFGIRGDEQIDTLADEILKHAPHVGGPKGQMYKSDVLSGVTNYVKNLSNMQATHLASLSALTEALDATARAASSVTDGVPLHEVLRKAGHDIADVGDDIADSIMSKRNPGQIAGSLRKIAELRGENLSDEMFQELANELIPRDLAKQLEMTVRVTNPADEVNGIVLSFFDKYLSMFKGNVTLPFPSFAMRNFISGQTVNLTSGDVHGVTGVYQYFKALGQYRRASKIGNYEKIRAEMGDDVAQWWRELAEHDVVGESTLMALML